MTLPLSGPISFNDINVELDVAGTTQASLGQASYRTLAGVPSGEISLSDFYGKANQFAFTISSNQTNANLRTLAVNAGWNESVKVVATINSGIFCSSNSTGTPGLTISGSFPGGVELINNGTIAGMGGNGGTGGSVSGGGATTSPTAGTAGGLALSVSTAVTINNIGTIGGGGGGGGGGGASSFNGCFGDGYKFTRLGGGGGGGGFSGAAANSTGGSRGPTINSGCTITASTNGTAGTSSAAGVGGTRGTTTSSPSGTTRSGAGGNGGSRGAVGATGEAGIAVGITRAGAAGGAGGGAISGNSNITYIATGTRLGAIT
jgi:hypothetical protein